MAAGRGGVTQQNDLDGGPGNSDSIFLGQVNDSFTMVFMAGSGAWHTTEFGYTNNCSVDNHGNWKYPMSFVDGHGKTVRMNPGKGTYHSKDEIDFTNDEIDDTND
ncbi:MAG: hypothetical protein MK132_27285 [Lentisphaerales bacterium]|nr:hypothetical protein [Lentisphaerales bacterium]